MFGPSKIWFSFVTFSMLWVQSGRCFGDDSTTTRFIRFQMGDTCAYGVVEGDHVRQLDGDLFGIWAKTDTTFPLNKVTLLVPATPSKVFAMAGNYRDHLADDPLPEVPQPFYKPPSCLIPHGAHVVQPKDHDPVHYEAELVVVIGKRAKNVAKDDALDYVLGVTCGNDISARVWQKGDVQWWRAKGHDTFGPCGPSIVSGLDYDNLNMELRVNGEVKQKTNTKHMIFGVADCVSFISKYVTLEPGDLIFTGTTGKTAGMQIGDVMTVEIEGIGTLQNTLVAAE